MSMKARARTRLDQLLVERGLVETRARAQALVLAGLVRVGSGDSARTDRRSGDLVDADVVVTIAERDPYVSRGAHKLAAALDAFAIDPSGLVCLDVGASTGGFTDLLLQRGAARVHAIDVGRGQLAERLRHDPRVVSLERTNARTLDRAAIGEPCALAVVDVSFISLALVLGPIVSCLTRDGRVVPLVKPQFEAGRVDAKGGVVRDRAVHRAVLERAVAAADSVGLGTLDAIASPILGPAGNREFLLDLRRGVPSAPDLATRLDAVALGDPGAVA